MASNAFSQCKSLGLPIHPSTSSNSTKRKRPPNSVLVCSSADGSSLAGTSTGEGNVFRCRRRWVNPERRKRILPSEDSSQNRQWVENVDPYASPSQDRFLIVSYNILGDDNVSKHKDLYAHNPPYLLKWERRKQLLCKEFNGWKPDILCLQEVDRFHDVMHVMKEDGYSGSYKRRTGEAMDGCAILWKESMFHMLGEENIEFKEFGLRDNVAQLIVFELLEAKPRRVVVGNIHVLFNPNRGDVKLGQIRLLTQKAHDLSKKWGGLPIVLAGDFNSTPQSAIYKLLASSELNIFTLDRRNLSGQTITKHRRSSFSTTNGFNTYTWTEEEILIASGNTKCEKLEIPMKLRSAYTNVQGTLPTRDVLGEPLATTYHSNFLGTVDYLWHTKGLVPTRVLDTLPMEVLRNTKGLPSKKFGSDHLALVSEFAFVEDEGTKKGKHNNSSRKKKLDHVDVKQSKKKTSSNPKEAITNTDGS